MDQQYIRYLGLTFFIILIFKILYLIWTLIRKPYNLIERYGKGWAIITGSTDGIGKGFCIELAKKGFNICLFGRSKEKILKVKEELLQVNKLIQVEFVVYDFKDSYQDQEFEKNILKQLKSEIKNNISILVNNVGILYNEEVLSSNFNNIADTVTINCIAPVLLTKILYPYLQEKQNKKSGIVNISSVSAIFPIPFLVHYSATKAFNDMFSRSIAIENSCKNIDVLSLYPVYVHTNIMNFQLKIPFFSISPQQCAQGCLQHLGYEKKTGGHIYHRIQLFVMSLIPQFILKYIFQAILLYVKKQKEKQKKQ